MAMNVGEDHRPNNIRSMVKIPMINDVMTFIQIVVKDFFSHSPAQVHTAVLYEEQLLCLLRRQSSAVKE